MKPWVGTLLAGLLAAGAAMAADAPDKGDRAPDWAKKPTANDILALFPKDALQKGISGRATLECQVSTDGALRKCEVVDEKPLEQGFGAAAIALTPQFRFKPALKDGKPVESQVRFSIVFDLPREGMPGGDTVLTTPIWVKAPSRADVDAVYPPRADVEGLVTLDCALTETGALKNCVVAAESPRTKGFGQAAKSLAPKFQAAAKFSDGKSVKGYHVRLAIRFDKPGTPGDAGGVKPAWIGLPTGDDMAALYPAEAKANKVSGRAVLDCVIAVGGALTDCHVASEEPKGQGFGEAALKLAPQFHMNPWTTDGRPVDGLRIRLPVKFEP